MENKKRPSGPVVARAKQGPHGPSKLPPHEVRRMIIEKFISRWRKEVGDDFYPALRLIIPEKDRDRAMVGISLSCQLYSKSILITFWCGICLYNLEGTIGIESSANIE